MAISLVLTAGGAQVSGISFRYWLFATLHQAESVEQLIQECDIYNLYFHCNPAPGVGKSRSIRLQVNALDETLTCTISDAGTDCNDTVHTDSVVDWDEPRWIEWASNTPPDQQLTHGVILYREEKPLPGPGAAPASGGIASKLIAERII